MLFFRLVVPTFLDRYVAGEYVAVWDDLVSLGARVRHSRYYEDAKAVADETMRRARQNVKLLLERLEALDYRFLSPEVYEESRRRAANRLETILNEAALRSKMCDGTWEKAVAFRKSKQAFVAVQKAAERNRETAIEFIENTEGKRPAPWSDRNVIDRPTRQTPSALDRLERMVGGPLPLSMRAWYEHVGGVSLLGWHSTLCPNPDELESWSGGSPQPLVIWPLAVLLTMAVEEQKRSPAGKLMKLRVWAGAPGCDSYGFELPCPYADDTFDHDKGRTFVAYLRRVFAWGGFPIPGKMRPGEIAARLKEGFLPF